MGKSRSLSVCPFKPRKILQLSQMERRFLLLHPVDMMRKTGVIACISVLERM